MSEEGERVSPMLWLTAAVATLACVVSIGAAVVTYQAAHRARMLTFYYNGESAARMSDREPIPRGFAHVRGYEFTYDKNGAIVFPDTAALKKEIEAANAR